MKHYVRTGLGGALLAVVSALAALGAGFLYVLNARAAATGHHLP